MGENRRVGPRGPLERQQSALGREGAKREREPCLGLRMILIFLPPLPDLEVENPGLWDDCSTPTLAPLQGSLPGKADILYPGWLLVRPPASCFLHPRMRDGLLGMCYIFIPFPPPHRHFPRLPLGFFLSSFFPFPALRQNLSLQS